MSSRWIIVTLLFAATAISYLDRQALSVVAPRLRDELGFSNFDYATLVFSFLLAYTLAQGVMGWLMDRLGARIGFAAIMAWWSAAAALHAIGQSLTSFALLRFILGIGEAGTWAVSVRAVAEWFPPEARGLPNGIWGAGTSVGTILAVPLVAWLSIVAGWRTAFLVTGLIGFVWLMAWLALYRSPGPIAPPIGPASEPAAGGTRDLLRSRNAWALVLARMFADPIAWFYNAWVPEYLFRSAGFTMGQIARFAWIPFVANGVGIVLGGLASDLLCRRWKVVNARMAVMLSGVLLMTVGVVAAFQVSAAVALAAISVAVFGFGLWAPNMMTLGADAFPRNPGSITGLSGMGAGIGGMAYTLLTGWMLDAFGYAPVFVASGLLPLVAFAILYTLFDRSREATPHETHLGFRK